jgi:hypothetical protein
MERASGKQQWPLLTFYPKICLDWGKQQVSVMVESKEAKIVTRIVINMKQKCQ